MYQLLIVCPPQFHAVCENYARFKRASGITCLVYPFESATAQQRLAAHQPFLKQYDIDPEKLSEPAACLKADLLRYFVATRTRFVLLAGDADVMPVPWIEFMQGEARWFYSTDLYYADLFKIRGGRPTLETWDPDADSVKGEFRSSEVSAIDWVPDLAVGRIPASSVNELETAFTRLMNRHARAPRCLLLRGNDPQLTPWLDDISKKAAEQLRGRGYGVTTLAIADDTSSNAAQGTLDLLHSHLAEGVEYIFWFGHGATNGWGSFGPYFLSFLDEVPKVKGAPIVFSMSCAVGAYTRGVYDTRYFSGGVLTGPTPLGSRQAPSVPDALQPAPSTLEADFAPEEWLVRHQRGATTLIAGHSWGSLGSDYLGTQPLDFIRMLPAQSGPPPFVGQAFNSMLQNYLRRYKPMLATNEAALNHLLRIHLFGDPTSPLFC